MIYIIMIIIIIIILTTNNLKIKKLKGTRIVRTSFFKRIMGILTAIIGKHQKINSMKILIIIKIKILLISKIII